MSWWSALSGLGAKPVQPARLNPAPNRFKPAGLAPKPSQSNQPSRPTLVLNEDAPAPSPSMDKSSGSSGGSGGLTVLTPQQLVISMLADFPHREEVLTGVAVSNSSLRIPEALQDLLMVVRVDARRAVLVYDPAYTSKVKDYFGTLRSAASTGLVLVDQDAILATSRVIRDVRLAAESRRSRSGVSGVATSDGSKMFREWITIANESRATDLHMEVLGGGRAKVFMRVDGKLEPIDASNEGIFTDHDVLSAMQGAFNNMADQKSNSAGVFKEDEAMSCMIGARLGIPNLRLRFTSERAILGPKSVCRLLHSDLNMPPMSFASMGLAPSQVALLKRAQRLKTGAILQIGVTGSGKTTVAKTLLETHPLNGKAAFYGIADPVEYFLKNTTQIYVQRDIMTKAAAGADPYARTIENLMRMDPDLIDVGEVRDSITARALATVTRSGHLALGTLHGPSVSGVIDRLIDPEMGLTREGLTSSGMLGFLSYKALIPEVCTCAFDQAGAQDWHIKHREVDEANYIRELVQKLRSKFDIDSNSFKYVNPEGCPVCRHRGTKGLTMVAEMMMPDDEWRDISATGNDRLANRYWRDTYSDKTIDSPNMDGKLVAEHTIYKALLGQIDPRNIESFGLLEQLEVLKK